MNQQKEPFGFGRPIRPDVFRLALDVSADLIYIVDAVSARIVEVNRTVCQELGYTRDELLSMHSYEITTANPADAKRRLGRLVATRPRSGLRKAVLRRKDGTLFPVEINRRAVVIGEQPYMITIARDLTERLRAEQALRRSEERFALFMEHMPGPAFIKDAQGRYVYVNPACGVSQRVGPKGWMGKTDEDLFPAEAARELRANDRKVLQSGEPLQSLEIVHWPDEIRHYLTSKFLIPESSGLAPLLGGAALDVTDLKRTEEALRRSEQQLRVLIRDRERLARDLHDNIVQAIYAIGMKLEDTRRLIHEQSDPVAVALAQAVERLNGVIREVRQYIETSGQQALSGRELRGKLVTLVRTLRGGGAPRFKLKLDAHAVERLTAIEADHVLQIAREALSNAAWHSHARAGALTIKPAGDGVEFEVADDGTGFDPLGAQLKERGLHNMRSRAQQMGAQFEVRSAPGQGTRIILHITRTAEGNGPR